MSLSTSVLIIGASARAAGFSALRAGLRPWCADLFRDADLQLHCGTLALPLGPYPQSLLQAAQQAPPGPWMYTGALENRPALVRHLARQRPLWGNGAPVLAAVRSPGWVADTLAAAGLPRPAVARRPPEGGRWLIKRVGGAGGAGMVFFNGDPAPPRRRVYYQEYVEGAATAAIYLGDGVRAQLLGATRQLVGEPWLHAAPFHYCGSLGPLPLAGPLRQRLEALGDVLVRASGLRGLFGIDSIVRDGVPWPVEINPRYSASVEVLEYAGRFPALALHRAVFDVEAPPPPIPVPATDWVGKAVLFAQAPLTFPADGPWLAALRQPDPVHELPAFADIPPAGQVIAAGAPVLTLFARAGSPAACEDVLRQTAADLDRWLFGR